jgi:hypothetical protein
MKDSSPARQCRGRRAAIRSESRQGRLIENENLSREVCRSQVKRFVMSLYLTTEYTD